MKLFTPRVTIAALAVVFLAVTGMWAYEVWQKQQWQGLVRAYAASEGKTRAKQDFLDGNLQLHAIYEPDGSGKTSATNEGPFKIVPVSYNPNVFQDRYTTEVFIEAYNERMRSLHEHPEKTTIRTNAPGRQ